MQGTEYRGIRNRVQGTEYSGIGNRVQSTEYRVIGNRVQSTGVLNNKQLTLILLTII